MIFREVYEHMLARYREKGKLRTGICEQPITSQQVKEARTEYDEAARLCIFRAQSLKQGQGHSLLTQAARHHTAQVPSASNMCSVSIFSALLEFNSFIFPSNLIFPCKQLNLFFKAVESLVEVDPKVKQVSKEQHIDCQTVLNEGEDDGSEMRNNFVNNEHGVVSFDS